MTATSRLLIALLLGALACPAAVALAAETAGPAAAAPGGRSAEARADRPDAPPGRHRTSERRGRSVPATTTTGPITALPPTTVPPTTVPPTTVPPTTVPPTTVPPTTVPPTTTAAAVTPVAPSGRVPRGGMFPTLPPGSALPSDAECANRVQRDAWEPRPENARANRTVPPGPVASRSWGGAAADRYRDRVTGAFTGTTDEIIQWASCKWGFDTEITRAQAVQESGWVQSARGDGGISYGLLQIKSTVWTGTAPWSLDSTAYNVDWSLGMRRACYEGLAFGEAARGDIWACIGAHFSGSLDDAGARAYIERVRGHLAARAWLGWASSAGGRPPTAER